MTAIEEKCNGTGRLSAVTCPAGAAALAPGATDVCTASYLVAAEDARLGELANTVAPVTG